MAGTTGRAPYGRALATIASLLLLAGATLGASDRLAEARAAFDAGVYHREIELVKPLLARSNPDPAPRVVAAEAFLTLHDSASSRRQVDWLSEHAAGNPRLPSLLGRTLFLESEVERKLGRSDDARDDAAKAARGIDAALASSPADRVLLSYRAVALWRAGDVEGSLAAHRAWIAADPRDPGPFGSAAHVAADRATIFEARIRWVLRDAAAHGWKESKTETASPDMELPIIVQKVEPDYPEERRRARKSGSVTLVARVAKDGTVRLEGVARASHVAFARAAAEAIENWRYKPATKDRRPVAIAMIVRVTFTTG